ncbi:MAG: GntR family transcriptional regulator [Anaerolineales bacterium]
MDINRVDTKLAYSRIRDRITELELAPGSSIDPGALAQDLDVGHVPTREALKLLAHDGLVEIADDGIFVASVNRADLEQLSELRVLLEGYSAKLAAERATDMDLTVLNALKKEQDALEKQEIHSLFAVDHKFHQAVARAAHNRYMAEVLDRFFGLSQRLWYLAGPELSFLPAAVEQHRELIEAIEMGQPDKAEEIMQKHVREFYERVQEKLDVAEKRE